MEKYIKQKRKVINNMKKPYAYVAHICKKCGCMFIAEDYTKCNDIPSRWRYCEKCAKKLGINYETQTPRKNRTPEEQKKVDEKVKRLLDAKGKQQQQLKLN